MTTNKAQSDWKTWNRQEWNDALVEAVFFDPRLSHSDITRMDATSQFLSRVAQADPKEAAKVRPAFVKVFGDRDWKIRSLFDSWAIHRDGGRADFPPYFAQLYLSLLVASADEETYEEGNFRDRFAKMLRMPSLRSFSFSYLPTMWRELASWSRKRGKRARRRLILPDPGHEVLIGYAKRLAFPTFVDQRTLAELLTSRKLSIDSPISQVLRSIGSSIWSFGERFREEFSVLDRLVDRGDLERAQDTPLWGAVQDITWEYTRNQARLSRAGFVLELDPADPHEAQFNLLSTSATEGGQRWRATRSLRPAGQHGFVLLPRDGTKTSLSLLMEEAGAARPAFRASDLFSSVHEGCVGIVLDEFGAWTSSPYVGQSVECWLLVTRDVCARIRGALSSIGRRPPSAFPIAGLSDWLLIGSLGLPPAKRDEVLAQLQEFSFFSYRLQRSRPTLIDPIRIDGKVILRAPLVQEVQSPNDDGLTWSIEYPDGAQSASMPIAVTTERVGKLSSDGIGTIAGPCRVEVVQQSEENSGAPLVFQAVATCPPVPLKRLQNPSRWLVDGDIGDLVAWVGVESPDQSQSVRTGVTEIRPIRLGGAVGAGPREIDSESVPPAWSCLFEVLHARFASTVALSEDEIESLLARVSLASRHGLSVQDLVENGFVVEIRPRNWSGLRFAAAPLRIAVDRDDDEVNCSLVGLSPQIIRDQISHCLCEGTAFRYAASPGFECLGVLRFTAKSISEVSKLAEAIGAQVIEPSLVSIPGWATILENKVDPTFMAETPMRKRRWSGEKGYFVDAGGDGDIVNALFRTDYRSQPSIFEVVDQGRRWTTRSHRWAAIVHAALGGQAVGVIDQDGTLVTSERRIAMPRVVRDAVLSRGGGVCWRDSDGLLHYPMRAFDAARALLDPWIASAPLSTSVRVMSRAKARLTLALAVRRGLAIRSENDRGVG